MKKCNCNENKHESSYEFMDKKNVYCNCYNKLVFDSYKVFTLNCPYCEVKVSFEPIDFFNLIKFDYINYFGSLAIIYEFLCPVCKSSIAIGVRKLDEIEHVFDKLK